MDERLHAVARAERLLIASDFDGTLAPIVPEPRAARIDPGASAALALAARLARTHAAIVSGRDIDDLSRRVPSIPGLWLVGCHGAQLRGPGVDHAEPVDARVLLKVREELERAAPSSFGFVHERKSVAHAVHTRAARPSAAAEALGAIRRLAEGWPGASVRTGIEVIEVLLVRADKGRAVRRLRELTGATSVLFLGDDQTDEDALGVLGAADAGVRVGRGGRGASSDRAGPVIAAGDSGEAVALLRAVVAERAERMGDGDKRNTARAGP